jgi:type IV fimbrial biogenesis protein FimT
MELMVSLAVAAILLSTAVPSFRDYRLNLRMKTAIDALQIDLNLARRYAISLNTHTIACPSTDGLACSETPDWQPGWLVFSDLNGDQQKQAMEPLLKQAGKTEQLSIMSSRSRTYLHFYPNGTAPGSNISIVFCDRRGAADGGKLVVSNTGRIRTQTGGIDPTVICP